MYNSKEKETQNKFASIKPPTQPSENDLQHNQNELSNP